jgi:hypothetical protein
MSRNCRHISVTVQPRVRGSRWAGRFFAILQRVRVNEPYGCINTIQLKIGPFEYRTDFVHPTRRMTIEFVHPTPFSDSRPSAYDRGVGAEIPRIGRHGIWAGVAEIRLRAENRFGFGPKRGYVDAFAPANSEEEFREAFTAWSKDNDVELVDVAIVLALHEFLRVDEKKLDCAVESLRSAHVVPSFHLVDPATWDEDPDTDLLPRVVAAHELVEFDYMFTDRSTFGFVVDADDEWVLVQRVDQARMATDGHVAARLDQIIDARVVEDEESFAREALALVGAQPAQVPELMLDSPRTILEFVEQRFPLVRFGLLGEAHDRVGRIKEIGPDAATIEQISVAAEPLEQEKFEYAEIFVIEFGRAYEASLANVLASRAAPS